MLVVCCLNRILLMNPFRSPPQVLHIDNRVVCFANRDTVFAHKDVFAMISAEPLCNCKIELYRFLTRFWSNSQFGCSSWWWGLAALHIICIQVSLSVDIVNCFFFTFYTSKTYCEAQARVRQGSARDGSQGKRPQSLNPSLELTLKLVRHLPPTHQKFIFT